MSSKLAFLPVTNADDMEWESLRKLVVSTYGHSASETISALLTSLQSMDSKVILKTLICVHNVLREGNERVVSDKVTDLDSLLITVRKRYEGVTESDATILEPSIVSYSKYLESRNAIIKNIKNSNDSDSNKMLSPQISAMGISDGRFRSESLTSILHLVPLIQDSLAALIEVSSMFFKLFNDGHSNNKFNINISRFAQSFLLRDAFSIHRHVSDAIVNVLETYFSLSIDPARQALSIYSRYCRQNDSILTLQRSCKDLGMADALAYPELAEMPATLAMVMEEYISQISDGETLKTTNNVEKSPLPLSQAVTQLREESARSGGALKEQQRKIIEKLDQVQDAVGTCFSEKLEEQILEMHRRAHTSVVECEAQLKIAVDALNDIKPSFLGFRKASSEEIDAAEQRVVKLESDLKASVALKADIEGRGSVDSQISELRRRSGEAIREELMEIREIVTHSYSDMAARQKVDQSRIRDLELELQSCRVATEKATLAANRAEENLAKYVKQSRLALEIGLEGHLRRESAITEESF